MLNKKSVTIGLVLLMIFSFVAVANAYKIYYPWPWNGTSLTVTYAWGTSMTDTSPWKTAFTTGVTDWNNTGTKAKYAFNTSSQNKLGIVNTPGGAYGYCWISLNTSTMKISSFSAAGNTATTGSFTGNMLRSTAGHELGHGLGLDDEFFASPSPLMDGNRDRSVVYTPKQDDINGIIFMYH